MRFDAQEYVDAFRATGEYPRIHDAIFGLVRDNLHLVGPCPAMDLGSCTGLLSARLVRELGCSPVVAVEGRWASMMDGVCVSGMKLCHMNIARNVSKLGEVAHAYNVRLVVARRILPELEECEEGTVARVGQALADAGVRLLALEGRVQTRKARARLSGADKEVEALSGAWKLLEARGNCRILERA